MQLTGELNKTLAIALQLKTGWEGENMDLSTRGYNGWRGVILGGVISSVSGPASDILYIISDDLSPKISIFAYIC